MSLIENTLFDGRVDKVTCSIERIKHFEPPEGYWLAFSGGKDSIVIHELAEMAGVKFVAHYNYTGIDPPQVRKFIRKCYPGVVWERPEKSYGQCFMHEGFPPTSRIKWCCRLLKEDSGRGVVMLGLRWAESTKRGEKETMEPCPEKSRWRFSPILDWTDGDVWSFIRNYKLAYPDLYDNGYSRLGCLLCPEKDPGPRRADMERFPKYENMWRVLFKRLWDRRQRSDKPFVDWQDSDAMFEWWIANRRNKKEIEGQCYLFDN